ncbi:response regulator transcription factor [Sulfurimonas sp.]
MKLLLLEDDIDYNATITQYLQSLGYVVESYENGEEALDAVYEHNYQLLLLDIRVPGINGYDILKQLRSEGNEIPIIFITSLTDIDNLSIGYELGCNDYIRKPFASKELRYRIEQVLKQFYFHSNSERIALWENYSYDIKAQQLYKEEVSILLSKREQEVVEYLVQHLGKYISIMELWQEIWEAKDITEADIRMCIHAIREKTQSAFIVNKRGIGYKIDRRR